MATGTSLPSGIRTVYVHGGPRGPEGATGAAGPTGPQGPGINLRGNWVNGTTYGPLDAVTYRSSLMDGVDSLYIQNSDEPAAISTTPPHLDLSRWEEVGAVQFGNAFGGIWEVHQINHGFEYVGTPVAFDFATGSYISADADVEGDIGIAVVREVINSDLVILQSTGNVPFIDSRVIWPDGSNWVAGEIYYVSTVRGRVQATPPDEAVSRINPILMAAEAPSPGARNGIALPWTPTQAEPEPNRVLVGYNRFYYDAAGGETAFSGADRNGDVLSYVVGEASNAVFLNGVLLDEGAYSLPDGTTVGLTAPVLAADVVEVWAAAEPVNVLLPSTLAKLDNFEGDFNSADTVFPLTVGGVAVVVASATAALIYLDNFPQEPGEDYTIVEDPGNPGFSAVQFAEPIPGGTRFHGLLFEPAEVPIKLPEVSWLYLSVAADGARFPATPVDASGNAVDAFDSLTSAFDWVISNYAAVNYLYIEVGAGTYDEVGNARWDPTVTVGNLELPMCAKACDIYVLDATPANTVFNISGTLYAHKTTEPGISGGTWNFGSAWFSRGFYSYGDTVMNPTYTGNGAVHVTSGFFAINSGGSLTINYDGPSAALDIYGSFTLDSCQGDINLNYTNPVLNQRVIRAYGGDVFLRGDVTVVGADATAKIYADWGCRFDAAGVLTGVAVTRDNRAAALIGDLP